MKRILFLLSVIAACVFFCVFSQAETSLSFCINEICSSNGGHYTVNGSAPDYIELRNLTKQSLPLGGYYLSDDEDHLQKFALTGYTIPKNGYLVLAADKRELPFKLSASGEELYLSDANGTVLQHVTLPPLAKDETYSLQENGEWHVTDPSPTEANLAGEPYVAKVFVAAPRFSHAAGFYDDPFDLTLEGYKTYRIYYTTDGSVPDENATLYAEPIHIEDASSQPNTLSMRTDVVIGEGTTPSVTLKKATILRAVAIDPDGNRSSVVTNTYFVGFQNYESYQNIPILSIVADPYDLFDEQDGIYVRGKTYAEWLADENRDQSLVKQRIPTNYRMRGREWEIPVSMQWFDENNSLRLSQNAGARIHGNWSRESAKKSLNLYARKEYGEKTFRYEILEGFPDKEKLVVRANLGKDGVIHQLLQETGLPVSACTPCILFLNGEYWGFYEIREKQDEEDIAGYFGLSSDDLLVIKNNELIAGTIPDGLDTTSTKSVYRNLLSQVSALDASTPDGYAKLNEIIDVDSYITYMAGITYLNNSDFRANFTMWRTAEAGEGEYADGRWRWIFQDLDNCCFSYDGATEIITLLPDDAIFSAFWKNKDFQTKFLTRVMDFANVELTPEYVKEFITPAFDSYNPYLIENYVRFPGKNSSLSNPGASEISSLMTFFNARLGNMVSNLNGAFQLTRGTSTLSLTDLTSGVGLVINGHQAHIYGSSWTGVYFKGCTVTIRAEDIPGCRFLGWYEGETLLTADSTLSVSTDEDRTLTPQYESLPTVVFMGDKERVYGTGAYGFTKPLVGSEEDEAILLPDEAVSVERKYFDSTITFFLDDSILTPQGFTLTVPMRHYISAGGTVTVSVPDSSAPINWQVSSRGSGSYRALESTVTKLTGGLVRISFTLPDDQLAEQTVTVHLEAVASKRPASFVLRGFRIYGIQMDEVLGEAYDFARVVKAIGADESFAPDLDAMGSWSDERILSETAALREQLQTAMAEKAITTVGALANFSPAWEGMEAYPAVVIDENLIRAYYNKKSIDCSGLFADTVYRYELENGDLVLTDTLAPDSVISFDKEPGTFFLLDRPIEDVRFHAVLDTEPIGTDLISTLFYGIKPRNHLWVQIETYTTYQEAVMFELPASWTGKTVFVYSLEGEEPEFIEPHNVQDGAFRMIPQTGRFLVLEQSLASFAEQAEWDQQEIDDLKKIRAKEDRQSAALQKKLILAGAAVVAVLAATVAVAIVVLCRRRKKVK